MLLKKEKELASDKKVTATPAKSKHVSKSDEKVSKSTIK
jgi:hypothetical protein